MKVNWTSAARTQLRDIHTFIAGRHHSMLRRLWISSHDDLGRSRHSRARVGWAERFAAFIGLQTGETYA